MVETSPLPWPCCTTELLPVELGLLHRRHSARFLLSFPDPLAGTRKSERGSRFWSSVDGESSDEEEGGCGLKSERGSQISRTVDQNHETLSDSSLLHQGFGSVDCGAGHTFVTLVCWQPGLLMQWWCRCVRRWQSSLARVLFLSRGHQWSLRVKDARSSRKSIGEKG